MTSFDVVGDVAGMDETLTTESPATDTVAEELDRDIADARRKLAEAIDKGDQAERDYEAALATERTRFAAFEANETDVAVEAAWAEATAALTTVTQARFGWHDHVARLTETIATLTSPGEADSRREKVAARGRSLANLTGGTMARKNTTNGMTALDAILSVLHKRGGKVKVSELFTEALPLATSLKGKHPKQTMYSVLYAEAKKSPSRVKQTGKGEFQLSPHGKKALDSPAAEAPADDQPAEPVAEPTPETATEPEGEQPSADVTPDPKPSTRGRKAKEAVAA